MSNNGLSHIAQGLPKLEQLSVLSSETVAELNAALKERDTASIHPGMSPSAASAEAGPPTRDQGSLPTPAKGSGLIKPDKRQIEQRIEEDRERHKRLKESLWAVSGEGFDEYDKIWDEASDFGEDDILQAQEETAELMGISVQELERRVGKFQAD